MEDRRTFDSKIAEQLIGVGGIDQLDKVDLGILCTNHGRDVDGGILVEGTSGLQWLFKRGSFELKVCKVGDTGLLLDFDCRRCHDYGERTDEMGKVSRSVQ